MKTESGEGSPIVSEVATYTGAMRDGWVVAAGTGAICNNSGAGCGSAGVARTGTQMAFLDWSNTLNTTTQTLNTVIGETYTISYFVAGTDPNFLEVTFGSSTLFNGTSPTNGVGSPSDYVQYTFTSTATSTSTPCWPSQANVQWGAKYSSTMSS